MDLNKFDTVLIYDPVELLNEDKRLIANSQPGLYDKTDRGYNDYIDPEMYSLFSFGLALSQQLNNIGDGFSAEVTDFKRWVVVKINHHNVVTGKTGSKTFLVVFKLKGDGLVFSTHNKYRTISGASQAASYIRSASNQLRSETSQKL